MPEIVQYKNFKTKVTNTTLSEITVMLTVINNHRR